VSNTTHTAAGTYASDTWSFTGTANYNNIGNTTITDSISKSTAVVVVTPYTSPTTTYTSLPHTATVTSITGVNGETGATVGTVDVSHTTHTAAGTYASDTWSFTGTANYNDIGNTTITDSISKKLATWTTDPKSKYWGQADPPLTGSGSGFVSTDGVSATYSRDPGSDVGMYHITAMVSATMAGALDNYTITNNGNTFTVNPDPTAIALDIKTSGTNFDCVNDQYTATLKDTLTNTGVSGVQLNLTIGTQGPVTATTNGSGMATFTLDLNQAPASVTESIGLTAAWSDPNRTAPTSPVSRSFAVNANPNVGPGNGADTLYTGSRFFWTTSSTSSTASLT